MISVWMYVVSFFILGFAVMRKLAVLNWTCCNATLGVTAGATRASLAAGFTDLHVCSCTDYH